MARLIFARHTLFALLLIPTVTACSTLGGSSALVSSDAKGLSGPSAAAIATDLSGHLVDHLAPRTTTITIVRDGSEFALALENALRRAGYAVASDGSAKSEKTLALRYMVDEVDGQIMVRLATQTIHLARMYKLSSAGAEPISPLSVRSEAEQKQE